MAASAGCPAAPARAGHRALRLAGPAGLRGTSARPPVIIAAMVRTG